VHTSTASQTVQRFLKLIPSERLHSSPETLADCLRLILCQRLLLDERKGKRFPIHEILLQYDGVVNIIRRGDFKKLDQELETGWKKGMYNFEKSISLRFDEGLSAGLAPEVAVFSWDETQEYLERQTEISR